MGLDRRLDPLTRRLESDPPVDVMEQRRDDECHDERGEQPSDHERQEWKAEDVKADVLAELGVENAKVHAVGEQQPLLPAAAHPEAGHQGEQGRKHKAHQPPTTTHDKVIVPQQVLLRTRRPDQRGQAIGHREVGEQDPEEQEGEQSHKHHLSSEHRHEHVFMAEGVEPEVVGPEAGDAAQR